jgi:hypothetical protein
MDDNKIGAEIRKYILHTRLRDTSTTDKVQEYLDIVRAAGYRVITGGQVPITYWKHRDEETDALIKEGTGPHSGGYWEVCDAETGEILKAGFGLENLEEATEEHWIHEDGLHDLVLELGGESDSDPRQGISLPEGLMDVLEDWASDNPGEVHELLS